MNVVISIVATAFATLAVVGVSCLVAYLIVKVHDFFYSDDEVDDD